VSSPAISVVIPTHGGGFVAEAMASVIAQTTTDWELVVVDDGSRDGTAQLAAKLAAADPRIRVITHGRNTGIVAARNRGLSAISTSSTYVAFLDHDDIWTPTALELLTAALVAAAGASAAHGMAIKIDRDGRPRPGDAESVPSRRMGLSRGRLRPWPPARPTEFANLVVEDCVVSMGSGLIRRAALDRVGWFDPRAERAEDYDMWVRLSRIGPIAFVSRDVLHLRLHEEQTSRRPRLPRGHGLGYVRYKMIASPENTPEQRRLAIAGFRARQGQLLVQHGSHLLTAWENDDYSSASRYVAEATYCVARYVRGRPFSWHR
jgi:glycosyltransferase involved in cell wall biosynthesis